MKKLFKSILALAAAITLLTATLQLPVSAASAVLGIDPNKKTFTVGETVTVTGTLNAGVPLYSFDGSITYDSSKMQFVSGGTNHGNYIQFVDSNLTGQTSASFSATFKAIAEGSHYFKFSGEGSPDGATKVSAESGATITITAAASSESSSATVSNNANLKSLSLSGATLSPAFSASKTGYTATVANTVESVKVTARAADSGAKVEGTGTYPLEVGSNKISIVVTAASGAKKTYSISVKRQTPEETAAEQAELNKPDPLEITVNAKSYRVVADISALAVPSGFTAAKTTYNDTEVGILTDQNSRYTLYYLTDAATGETQLFTLEEGGEFKRLVYLELGGKMYIFERPEVGLVASDSYYETTLSLDSGNAKAYAYKNAEMADIYVVYCWSEGTTRFYRYDKQDNTIQRAPDFHLAEQADAEPAIQNDGILGRFMSMPTNGKIVVLVLALTVICIIALIVLIIIKLCSRKAAMPKQLLDDGNIFDTVDSDGFSLDESPIPLDTASADEAPEIPEESEDEE